MFSQKENGVGFIYSKWKRFNSTEESKMDETGLLQWEGLNGFQVSEDNPRKLNEGVGEMGDA